MFVYKHRETTEYVKKYPTIQVNNRRILSPAIEIEGKDLTMVYGPTMTRYFKKLSSWSLRKVNTKNLIIVRSF